MNEQSNQKLLLGVLAHSVLLSSMGTSMVNLALPGIGSHFGVDFSSSRLLILTYLAATTLLSLFVGRFADLNGRFRVLVAGTTLFVAGSALAASASSFWILILARFVQGSGAAALIVLPIVIATEAASPNRSGRSIGLLATMSAVGTASGPSVGGFALDAYGWRSVFLIMTALGAINLLLLRSITFTQRAELPSDVKHESLGKIVRSILSDAELKLHLTFNLIVSAVMMASLVVGPFVLSKGLKLSPAVVGLIMSAGPITSIVSGLFAGFAVDRFGTRATVAAGFIQLLVGAISFFILPISFGASGFVISAVLLSLGYQTFLSANSNRIMRAASPERRGLASGALSLTRNLGLIAGASTLGTVFDFFAERSGSSLGGLQAVFATSAVLVSLSFVTFLIKEQRSNDGTKFPVEIR